MKVEVNVNVFHHLEPSIEAKISRIDERTVRIMANTQDTLAKLAAANASLDGIQQDILALKDLVANGGTPQEVADAVNALADKAAGIDSQT